MDVRHPAADKPTVAIDGRPRYWRDWLIAAGSVIFPIGVAFPFYLAWRDDRQRWVRACTLLVVAAVACFPLSDAGETIDGAAIVAVWLAGITAAIVLASTVSPENRRASGKDLAARRRGARRRRSLARRLSAAAIDPADPRPRGGTALTEPIVLIEGVHRSIYVLHDRDDRPLGQIQPADGGPPAYRSRYELLAPDGARVLAVHIAKRRGAQPDVILAADDSEVVRLQPTNHRAEPSEHLGHSDVLAAFGTPPRRRRAIRPSPLGFGARWLLGGHRPIGELRSPDGRRLARARVVTDAGGAEVARVTRVVGGAGPSGTDRVFVIDVREGADDRLRAAALFTGVLWDWNIISWDAEGG